MILVAGIGNVFLGDDGFGVEVVRRLGDRLPGARVVDFGIRGFDLAMALLEPHELVVLVDTVRRGGAPGTLYVLEIGEDSGPADFAAHGMDPAQVLRNVRALGGSPERVLLVGCEPGEFGEMGRLSPAVEAAVDGAIELVESLVRKGVAGRIDRAAEVKPAADSLARKLTGVEGGLIQSKSQSGQDPIRFAGQLDNQLAELYGYVTGRGGYIAGGAEGRPTRGAMERLGDLQQTWAPLRTQLQEIIDRDLVAFNALLQRLGLGAIVVPRRTIM